MTKRAKVGMRLSWDEIVADPQATAVQIRALAQDHPLLALAHPNCPPALWWDLAAEYPIEAQASVAYDLMTLEEPEAWATMQLDMVIKWIDKYIEALPAETFWLFVADVIERSIGRFTKGALERHRSLIQTLRDYVHGKASRQKRDDATGHWVDCFSYARNRVREAVVHAGNTAAETVFKASKHDPDDPDPDVEATAEAAMEAANDAERKWQWERLQDYLRAERLL